MPDALHAANAALEASRRREKVLLTVRRELEAERVAAYHANKAAADEHKRTKAALDSAQRDYRECQAELVALRKARGPLAASFNRLWASSPLNPKAQPVTLPEA